MTKKKKAYARAGVDVDLGNRLKRKIHGLVRRTHGPEVLGKIGGFGGLFAPNFSGMREPVLVASVDGVGTKLKIAFAMDRHDTVGDGFSGEGSGNQFGVVGVSQLDKGRVLKNKAVSSSLNERLERFGPAEGLHG